MKNATNIWTLFQKIKSTNPLIHNITNYVVMNQTANALLALGASPIMAHAVEELPQIAKCARALVINIGTLDDNWISSIKTACIEAKKAGIPVILDPVGSGFTDLRTNITRELIKKGYIDIIRCNASEAASIIDSSVVGHGVDSTVNSSSVRELALQIAKRYNVVLCITGEKDFVVSKNEVHVIENGHPIMAKVTGMGCTASAIVGAFAAVTDNYVNASIAAMVVIGKCGEKAASQSNGPGSFMVSFLDSLYQLDEETITSNINLHQYA